MERPLGGLLARVPSLYAVAAFGILGAVFIIGLAPRLDTDLWWHLEAGRYIAQHHAVPARDYLSFTANGHPWTDHEWLSELLLYGLYRLGGLWATIAFFAGLICATYALVYVTMLRRGIHPVLSLFVLCGAFVSASPTWGARPQMWTLFFLALFAFALHRYERSHDRRLLAVFPPATVIWTNLHGGFVLGIAFLAVAVVGHWLNNRLGAEITLGRRELRELAVALGLTVAATVVNPNGLREVLYPLVWLYPSGYANFLTEWVSVDFHMPQFMVFEAMLLLLLGSAMAARARANWVNVLTVVAFTHLALSQGRNVAVWSVLISPLVALYVGDAMAATKASIVRDTSQRRPVDPRTGAMLNLILLLLVCVAYPAEAAQYITPRALQANERQQYPRRAVSYLQRHRLPRNVLASYAWGGYLLWKTQRRYRDFIDGRANTLFSTKLLYEYLDAYSGSNDWRGVLARHRVGTVMVERGAPLAAALGHEMGWRRVYEDRQAAVFARE